MKTTWHRASLTLIGEAHKKGTLSFYVNYDLSCWMFGFAPCVDPCWYELKVFVGPLDFSIIYWRQYVEILSD